MPATPARCTADVYKRQLLIFEAMIRPPGCLCELSKLVLLYCFCQEIARLSIKIHREQHLSAVIHNFLTMYRPALFSLPQAPYSAPGTGVKNFLSFLVNVLSIRTYLFGQNCVTLMLHSLRNHKIRVKSDRQCHPPARETTKIHAKEVRQTLKSFASSLQDVYKRQTVPRRG